MHTEKRNKKKETKQKMKQNVTIILNNGYIKEFLKARETNKVLDDMFKKSRIIQENNGYSRWIIRNVDWEDVPVKGSEQEMILDIMEDIESCGEKIMVSTTNCDENKETVVRITVPEIPDDKKVPADDEESTEESLVELRNDQIVVSSRQVAKNFGKRHDHICRDIETIIGGLPKNGDTHKLFEKQEYTHPQNNRRYSEYLMNRDGFSLLVMGFTGKKALEWKLRYIDAFNQMEERLRCRPLPKMSMMEMIAEIAKQEVENEKRLVVLEEHAENTNKVTAELERRMDALGNTITSVDTLEQDVKSLVTRMYHHGYADSPKDAYGMIYAEMSRFGIRLKQRWDNFERKGNPYKSKLRMIMDDNKMKAALLSSYQVVARGFNEYLEEARA
jgi:phage regulatory protein, rha family